MYKRQIKLSPSLIASEADKKNLIALLRAEGELGGYHVQFNVVSTEKLRDAQEHPENYGDLLVRIAGYSAYFIELRREAQESIIADVYKRQYTESAQGSSDISIHQLSV